ncbi:MAG: TonB-dependent receptor [Candidatus Firestonebacteria bacterium]|nr:TonB-dependent receptor [Candidatus Firestonebacteria bacterium]
MKKFLLVLLLAVLVFGEEGKIKSENSYFQLDDVVVTGSRVEKALREAPGSLVIVDDARVKNGGDKNVGLAISDIPGVDSGKVGTIGQTQSVMIRGIGSEGTLVLINGVRLNSSYQGLVDFSSLPIDNIERIEVLKGPASSLYGADAAGGVINIITKSRAEKKVMEFLALYGSFCTLDLRASYADKIGALSLNVSGSYLTASGQRENSDVLSKNLNLSLAYDFTKKHTLKTFLTAYKSDSGAPGSLSWLTPLDRQQLERSSVGFDYSLPLTEDSDLKLKINGNKNILNFYQPGVATLSEERNVFMETTYTYDFGGINIITAGVSGNYSVNEQNFMGDHNANSKAIFAQDIFDLLGSWIFTASARYDSHSVYGDSFNPMFALVYNIEDGVQIKTSYGSSFRAPTFSELYATPAMGGPGNPALEPQKTYSFEAGLNLEFGRTAVLRTTYFNNQIKNLIEWAPVDPTYLTSFDWTPSNVGEAETYGVESELKIIFAENLSVFFGHTWLVTLNKVTDLELMYRPKNKANLGISYNLCGQKIKLDAEYYDLRRAGSGSRLPGFITLCAKAELTIIKEIALVFSANNILDIAYVLREDYPMPGRTLNAGLKFTF